MLQFIGILILVGLYCFVSRFILEDRLFIAGAGPFRMSFGPHSGQYNVELARQRQYQPHQPAEIDRLFQLAASRSPADSRIFAEYLEYLYARNCCIEQSSRLIQAALDRRPTSLKYYPVTVEFLLRTNEKEKAFRYFQKAVQMNPRILRTLIPIAVRNNVSVEEIISLTPRNIEGLSVLSDYLARAGPAYLARWLETIKDLQSMQHEPRQFLRIAEQALRLGEIDLAKQYAHQALRFPDTATGAKKILSKIDRKESKQFRKRGRDKDREP
jgi:tetratricopeptide (TPR) repeat protein